MIRRLFTFLSAVSLLLCAATVLCWVRSQETTEAVRWRSGGDPIRFVILGTLPNHFAISSGQFSEPGGNRILATCFGMERPGWSARSHDGPGELFPPAYGWDHEWEWHGFGRYDELMGGGVSYFGVRTVPAWLVATLTAMSPFGWAVARVRSRGCARRHASASRCARCGYDLRASPDRCPECGAAPARKIAT
jgi:hypothetical protein